MKLKSISVRTFLFIISVAIITVMVMANSFINNDVHQWRNDGKCKQCHVLHSSNNNIKDQLVIPAPNSHSDQFRKYTHGRSKNFSYRRCSSCHLKTECQACHNILPESHSRDFVKPAGIGMERHIMLASINPASCLTCHKSFAVECVNCHTPAEVKPWEQQARKKVIQENAEL